MYKDKVRFITLTQKSTGEKFKLNPKKIVALHAAEGGGTEIVLGYPDFGRVVEEDMLDVEKQCSFCFGDFKE